MTYHHPSREERYQISVLLKSGLSYSEISVNLARHKSTISREIRRNSVLRGYLPRQANILAEDRSLNSRNARQITHSDWLSVNIHLKNQWSPEQIASEVPMSQKSSLPQLSQFVSQALTSEIGRGWCSAAHQAKVL